MPSLPPADAPSASTAGVSPGAETGGWARGRRAADLSLEFVAEEMTLFQAARLGQSVNTRYVFIAVSLLLALAGYATGAFVIVWWLFLALQTLTLVVNVGIDVARRRGVVRDWHFWLMLMVDTLIIGGNALAFGRLGYFALLYFAIAAVGHSLGLPRAARVQLIAACLVYPAARLGGLALSGVAPSLASIGLVIAETTCLAGLGWLAISGPIRFTYRLRRARRALGALERGAFDTRLPTGTLDELGFLAVSFNRTAESLSTARDALLDRETELRHAQKLEAVGRLAGGIAHDFNNLLSVILGNLDLASSELPPGSQAHGDIAEAMRAARHAAGLTQQLLAFGRKQILTPETLDLAVTVREVMPMVARLVGAHTRTVIDLADDGCIVRADASQLFQVILNLAANARDAMGPTGGTLTLRVAREDVAIARARGAVLAGQLDARAPQGWVLLSVSDTGEGMTPEVMASAFEPFFTTKATGKGTGLGLATVHGIVAQSGGVVAVESVRGAGATFGVYLPLVAPSEPSSAVAAAVPAVQPPAPRAPSSQGTVVLLVEDESSVRAAMRRILERDGCTVIEAADGVEALERYIIRQRMAEHDPAAAVRVVVTDLMMPRLGGAELAARLRAHEPALPVILVSGYAEPTEELEAATLPGAVFIRKPPQADQLTAAVRAALGARPPAHD